MVDSVAAAAAVVVRTDVEEVDRQVAERALIARKGADRI